MLDAMTLTNDRYEKRLERTVKNQGWGSTDGAFGIIDRYIDDTTNIITERLSDPKLLNAIQGTARSLVDLSPQKLALCGLNGGISAIIQCQSLTQTMISLGRIVEHEVYAWTLENWDGECYNRIVKDVMKKYGSLKHRKQAMRSIARRKRFEWTKWSDRDRLIAGKWLLEGIINTPVFILGDAENPYLMMTEEALKAAQEAISVSVRRGYVFLPSISPPAPWVSAQQPDHDGWVCPLVRRYDRHSLKLIQSHIDDGTMQPTLDAVNAAQDVPWRINEWLVDVVEQCYAQGISVAGLPPRGDLDYPHRPICDGDVAINLHNRKVAEVAQVNRGYIGQRIELELDLATAKQLAGAPFWTPMNLDYRGRIYGMPRFNFQRQDYVRAMFLFEHGEVLDGEGSDWLAVHTANCGDFDKVSKQPFGMRIKWVDDNWDTLMSYAKDPIGNLGWTQADKPFMFLAACKELEKTMWGCLCHLPIAFDGSCNGLQHLCAMTLAPEGELVNLTPSEAPRDIYGVVADAAKMSIADDYCLTGDVLSRQALDFDVDRKLVKRGTMTYSYGSKRFGMANQFMEDLMKPLALEVLEGKRSAHPFGDDGGYRASRYLAGHVFRAIEDTVSLPAAAMRFLQGIARTLAHEGKPLVWHTPLGFPVLLRYPKVKIVRINLALHDRGAQIRFNPRLQEDTNGIDKNRAANAVAPGFVHSMDACHLMRVVLASSEAGIKDVALVHDSFGCLPSQAGKFRDIIRREFHKLYTESPVLSNILEEAKEQLETNQWRLPPLPTFGTLDLSQVLEAEYSFA